jgi:hypothetical protein
MYGFEVKNGNPRFRAEVYPMSAGEFPAAGVNAVIQSQIDANRAKPVTLHNSRILIAATMAGAVVSLLMAVCMVFLVISQVFPLDALTGGRAFSALQWALSAVATGLMCPWLWGLGRAMAFYQVRLDEKGVNFRLGTRKTPQELFIAWDNVGAIRHKRVGNSQVYWVNGKDGSEAQFSSYTFFRPKKVARLIAARADLPIAQL